LLCGYGGVLRKTFILFWAERTTKKLLMEALSAERLFAVRRRVKWKKYAKESFELSQFHILFGRGGGPVQWK
jgi:hypothetical protein